MAIVAAILVTVFIFGAFWLTFADLASWKPLELDAGEELSFECAAHMLSGRGDLFGDDGRIAVTNRRLVFVPSSARYHKEGPIAFLLSDIVSLELSETMPLWGRIPFARVLSAADNAGRQRRFVLVDRSEEAYALILQSCGLPAEQPPLDEV